MKHTKKLTVSAAVILAILGLQAQGCGRTPSCNSGSETCEECVARCVETQGVGPEICRTTACASLCGQGNQ